MEDNAKKIIEVIADELSMDEAEITLDSTFTDDLVLILLTFARSL